MNDKQYIDDLKKEFPKFSWAPFTAIPFTNTICGTRYPTDLHILQIKVYREISPQNGEEAFIASISFRFTNAYGRKDILNFNPSEHYKDPCRAVRALLDSVLPMALSIKEKS